MTARFLHAPRVPRADSRLPALLDAAARLFAERGYSATSMRDIAQAVEMLPGSLYYRFASKEELLVAVYEAGVHALGEIAAAGREREPWARLEAACAAHLETVLKKSDYAQVLIRVLPGDVPAVAELLRLRLLGALNWSRFWFDPAGRESPRSLARKLVALLREPQDG